MAGAGDLHPRDGGPAKKKLKRLHRVLDGDPGVPVQPEWIISRVCEEFYCTPSVAQAELESDEDLILTILQMRTYATTKNRIDNATDEKHMPDGLTADLVFEHIAELIREHRAE